MRQMLRYAGILGLICLAAGALLATVNSFTSPRIIARAKEEERASLKEVMPQAETFEPVESEGDIFYYKVYNEDGNLLGVAFKASGKGYSSDIETMVGMLPDGTITSIKILSQNETPGLGNQVAQPLFGKQFANINIKELDKIDSITGATTSSAAVIQSIEEKARQVKEAIENAR